MTAMSSSSFFIQLQNKCCNKSIKSSWLSTNKIKKFNNSNNKFSRLSENKKWLQMKIWT